MNNTGPNNQTLTTWGFVLALFGAILYFVSKGQFIFAGLVVAVIPVITLARSPEKWWLAAVMLANSGLIIPGAENISATMAISVGFCGLALLDRMMHRTDKTAAGGPQKFALALVVLIVGLASYRGWGLKLLGSAKWGGMQYLQLIVGLLFFYYSRQVKVSEKWLKRAVFLYFGLVFLPVVITLLGRYIPGVSALGAIVKIADVTAEDAVSGGDGIHRMQSLHYPATVIGYIALLFFDRTFKVSWKVAAFAGFSFILAGMSGHRVVIAKLGLIGIVYLIVRWKRIPTDLKFKSALAMVCMITSMYVFTQFLPLGYQRMLSVLPGIKVSMVAYEKAQDTSDWRIEMWRKMLPMLPQYALIGRGVGFDLREAYGAYTLSSDQTTKHEFFIAVHNYHNGPLWAAIDLGGTGAVLVLGFMISSLVRYGRRMRWKYSPFLGSAYTILYCGLISYFVFFLSVFGHHRDLIQMALIAAMLEIISAQAAPSDAVGSRNQRSAVRGLRPEDRKNAWSKMSQAKN